MFYCRESRMEQSFILKVHFTVLVSFCLSKIFKMKKQTSISMCVVNANAAGIDVGSRRHYVAVGQEPEDVRAFNVYTKDHAAMVEWLRQKGIVTVALESTGTYWETLFSSLQ